MPGLGIVVTASPRQRWALALLLFNPELKFKGRQQERRLYRTRRDLGLLEPSEAFLAYNHNLRPGDKINIGPASRDRTTRHRFTVSEEVRDFIIGEVVEKIDISSADLVWLEPIFAALEDKQSMPDVEVCGPYDQALDAERWRPLAEPEDDSDGASAREPTLAPGR